MQRKKELKQVIGCMGDRVVRRYGNCSVTYSLGGFELKYNEAERIVFMETD